MNSTSEEERHDYDEEVKATQEAVEAKLEQEIQELDSLADILSADDNINSKFVMKTLSDYIKETEQEN